MNLAPESIGLIAGSRSLPLDFARLARAAGVKRIVCTAVEGETDPALASLVTLTSGGTITDVAAVTQNGLPVVASLARADGAKSDDSQALSLYLPGRSPAQSLKPLSLRATATGSVAMAPTADGAVIAWVFREGRDAQLHAARVDATGKRTRDVTLTTSSGAKTDVAIAAADVALLALSTFDTDILLVRQQDLAAAAAALESRGHHVVQII